MIMSCRRIESARQKIVSPSPTSYVLCEEKKLLSLTLEEAERLAIENNQELQAVKQLVIKAKEGKLESYSKWFPTLSALTEAFRERGILVPSNSPNGFISQLSLNQTLFSAERYYGVKIAKAIYEELKSLYEAAVNDVIYSVRKAYFQIILDQMNIETAKEHVNLLNYLAERTADQVVIGTAIMYNWNQTKVTVSNATQTYYQYIRNKKTTIDSLVMILGYDPGSVEILLSDSAFPLEKIPDLQEKIVKLGKIFNGDPTYRQNMYQPWFPDSLENTMKEIIPAQERQDWENLAVNYRPELQVSKKELKVAEERLKDRFGEYIPSAKFIAGFGGNPTPYYFNASRSISSEEFRWSVGVSVSWLLFDSLGRERRIKQAKAEKNSRFYKYKEALQATYKSVRKQIFDMENALSQYFTAESNMQLAKQTVQQAEEQLVIGTISIFDYEITVDGYVEASDHFARSQFELLEAYYGLRHASGIDMIR